MALCDVWGKNWNLPLWQFFGGASDTLVTDLTIPIVTPDEAGPLAAAAAAEGFRHLKIKVGDTEGHAADLARIERVCQAAPGVALRIDANQAFSPDEAVAFVQSLGTLGTVIEMIEQPVPKDDFAGLKYVRERVDVPVFADEAARDVSDVIRLIREDAVDGVNVKLMKSGLAGALQIITLCRAAGKKLMLGCMLESSLGIAAAAQIAAGTGAFDFLDLDSHRLLAPVSGLAGGFVCDRDELAMRDPQPGWGVTVPDSLLAISR
jgi:L-alanine-DL-glutamate epimerase-like enolase superfamily enzyme